MSIKVRSGIFVGMAAITVALCYLFPNAATNPETGLLMWLPEDTPILSGEEIPVSALEAKTLPEDTTYLKMKYQEKGRSEAEHGVRHMEATLILMGSDRRSLHEPEICLRGQGWKVEKSTVVSLETKGGPLKVMDLSLGRWWRHEDGTPVRDNEGNKIRIRAHYIYWWVGRDDSTPLSKERIVKSALNNMFRNINDRWGYPSVMVLADLRLPADEGMEEAAQRAFDFIEEYAPKFQKSLGAVETGQERGYTPATDKKDSD